MRTNLERAENGRDLAALALNGSGHVALEDYEVGVQDALANLLHACRRYEIDFEEQLQTARRHHEHEARYAWDEIPD